MKPAIIGQAPARGSGGRPFVGRSGDRLRKLAGVEKLDDHFFLYNLIKVEVRKQGKGDSFDRIEAAQQAQTLLPALRQDRVPLVILMGRHVERVFFGPRRHAWMKVFASAGLNWVVLPHPSGVSHWWNDRQNRLAYAEFMQKVVRMYGRSN